MSSQGGLPATVALIKKDFALEATELTQVDTEDNLLAHLTKVIIYLLDKDFSRLLNACYRIDLSEQSLKEILNHENPDMVACTLAQAIIDREQQKVALREKYKS
jgi:hypothetical protein